MLTFFSPIVATIQNHIHLGVAGGTGLDADNAPPYRFSHVLKTTPTYAASAILKRSWTGAPSLHVISDSHNNPQIYKGFNLQLRVTKSDIDILTALMWHKVIYVDTWHCLTGQDHTPYVRTMAMSALTYEEDLTPLRDWAIVNFNLEDMDTIAAI